MLKFNIFEKLFDKLVSRNAIKTIEKLAKKEGTIVKKSVVPNGTIYSYKTKQGCDIMHHFDKQGNMIESVREVTNPNMERLGIKELQFDNYQSGLRGTYRTGPNGYEHTEYEDLFSKAKHIISKTDEVKTKKIIKTFEPEPGLKKRRIVGKEEIGRFTTRTEFKISKSGDRFFRKDISTPYGSGYSIEGSYKTPNGQQHCFRRQSDGFPPPMENEVRIDEAKTIPLQKFNKDTPGILYSNMSRLAV